MRRSRDRQRRRVGRRCRAAAAGTGRIIAIQPGAALAASSTGTVSVRADAFSNAGTVTGGVFEYAPDSASALNVGAGGDPLVDLTGIGSSLVPLGEADGTVTAIPFRSTPPRCWPRDGGVARPLDLQANGNVSGNGN